MPFYLVLRKWQHLNTTSSKMASISRDSGNTDMHVSFEDQQKINKFACQNARLDDILDELKSKENEQQALEDAESELLLAVEQEKIPFRVGDIFTYVSTDEAQQMIEAKKDEIAKEINLLRDQRECIKQVMSDLKVQLYAKFGSNINLEPE
ncbi:prefoldin subunit 4-like [Stegodyphus dumicola]|uniref:prefoldin subunit 4-like n=1 Tax=Stegodyphus dumicola TaxID=202533 RepID=UPI0015AA29E6|nr:prefoldin subunit 4-like [Stegodyphus dumicola]XP_035218421.1 prefoldin subunit 4-like [Stegodyphus dumicola]